MNYPKKFQSILNKAHTVTGMKLGEYWNEYEKLKHLAESLVKERIGGDRKGLKGEPNYLHSFRVFETVSKLHHWDDPDLELFLAALLHDIVEDGDTSFEELAQLGFSRRTLELIYLCTHDLKLENATERWILMMARLIEAKDEEAWFIKLADLADNLGQSYGLSEENRKFMVEVKAPIMLRLTEHLNHSNGWYSRNYYSHLKEALEKIIIINEK
jgi:(p)ppGpp synthase/HD superfamily hydrolase